MKVTLVRHLALLVEPGVCYGLDTLMHPDREADADRLGADSIFTHAVHIWSSPAARCLTIAERIQRNLGIPLTVDHRLREIDFGDWTGLKWEEIGREEIDRWAASPLTFGPPGGETGAALRARVQEFHDELHRDGRDCVVVSHGGPLKILGSMIEGVPIDLLTPSPALGSVRQLNLKAPVPQA
jgi:alpha-ribazole phosphatase